MIKLTQLCLLILILLFCSLNVSASAGIAPSKYTLNFVPNSNLKVTFDVHGYSQPIFIPGDNCKNWVTSNSYKTDKFHKVNINLKLPDKMPHPGKNVCKIFIDENVSISSKTMIGARTYVSATIEIIVPFPGKYAELSLDVKNTALGQPVIISPKVKNLGDEIIDAPIDIKVKDYDNKIVKSFNFMSGEILPSSEKTFFKTFDSEELGSARYKVYAKLLYDGEYDAEIINKFMIGDLYVELFNITNKAEKETYVPIEVDVESWWGEPLKNVYATIDVYSKDHKKISSFKTISKNLDPWEKNNLIGYLDASKMDEGIYNFKTTLHYKDKTSEFESEFKLLAPLKESVDNFNVSYIALLFNPIILLIIIFLILILDIVWITNHKKSGDNNG